MLLLLEQRASWSTFDHLCSAAASLCLSLCLLCTRLSTHFSAVHSFVIVCARDFHLLFKLPLKFRNVSNHTENRNSFASNQILTKTTVQLRLFLRCKHLNLHIDGIIKHYQTSLTTISSMLMIFTDMLLIKTFISHVQEPTLENSLYLQL